MESAKTKTTLWFMFLVLSVEIVSAEEGCHGAGFVATSVVLSVLITLLIAAAVYYWFTKRPKSEHLILETDPEKGKAEYAFDNPGFKDNTLLQKSHDKSTISHEGEKEGKQKWNSWAGISVLNTKQEKKRTVDDSSLKQEVKIVSLKGHDFAGLGFNICGNMKEGIYIKDILHRGPASESGKLSPGDRINSVTINFEHIVFEDALNILSFASPYQLLIEAKSGKILFGSSSKSDHPSHPLYRSSSNAHLHEVLNASKKSLSPLNSTSTSLQSSLSNNTTLERKESESPKLSHNETQKYKNNTFNTELKSQLEQKINSTEMRLKTEPMRINVEIQKTENKHKKFGVKVFPSGIQGSPKSAEVSQNDNNTNMEKNVIHTAIDEVDAQEVSVITNEEKLNPGDQFNRNDSLYGSGLRRDENGIPQEIPNHMLNAAVAARRNRKSQEEIIFCDEDTKVLKKIKGKAPSPPIEDKPEENNKIRNENRITSNLVKETISQKETLSQNFMVSHDGVESFSPDSDEEADKHSSVTTIELNSCDITVHQGENEEKQNRKTASTGDLTKIHKIKKLNTGNLERAQSLDITDSSISNLPKQSKSDKDIFDKNSEEDLFGKMMLNEEPRLSLVLDGLNTFQRNRLKKSTEWGNLEDAILRSNRDEDDIYPETDQNDSSVNSSFKLDEKNAEFDAVVNKINEIKKESEDTEHFEIKKSNEASTNLNNPIVDTFKHKNQLWPVETETCINVQQIKPIKMRQKSNSSSTVSHNYNISAQNDIWPRDLIEADNDQQKIGNNEEDDKTSFYEIGTHSLSTVEILSNDIPEIKKTHSSEVNNSLDQTQRINISTTNISSDYQDITKNEIEILANTDSGIQIIPNSIVSDEMIISETPPDDIAELEIIENVEEEQMNKKIASKSTELEVNTNINKIKTHRRQQIPLNENDEILLPPETNIADIGEVNEESPSIRSRNMDTFNSESSASCSNAGIQTYARNSETGELCKMVNDTDESKTLVNSPPKYSNETEAFIFNEKFSNVEVDPYVILPEDTNVSDDIKVSRHSFGSLERPKSDDVKSVESMNYTKNISSVTVNNVFTTNGTSGLHSLELPINDINDSKLSESELYTTASNQSQLPEIETNKISIGTPDLIKNVTITEAINTLNGEMNQMESFEESTMADKKYENFINTTESVDTSHRLSFPENNGGKHSSLTYITEIQVTPTNITPNVSEIEMSTPAQLPNESVESDSLNYEIKNNDTAIYSNATQKMRTRNGNSTTSKLDPEKELQRIQNIAQEQLKRLPEMRFSTSSYVNSTTPTEKRQSQVELLKSNFEKSTTKTSKPEVVRSRIPISTTMKTPPSTPEHRENNSDSDKESFQIVSPSMHSTPVTNTYKFQKPTSTKNVTVTSIRSNSKIPSGLPVSGIRPPIPPKRVDTDYDSLSSTSSSISSFKQWVFNPVNSTTSISFPGRQDSK